MKKICKIAVLALFFLAGAIVSHGQKLSSFSLIEKLGDEVVFLRVDRGDDVAFLYVDAGSGNPPIELSLEEFESLEKSLKSLKLEQYETIIPPDFEKNFVLVLRGANVGENQASRTFSIPKDSTPKEVKEWVCELKKRSELTSEEANKSLQGKPEGMTI